DQQYFARHSRLRAQESLNHAQRRLRVFLAPRVIVMVQSRGGVRLDDRPAALLERNAGIDGDQVHADESRSEGFRDQLRIVLQGLADRVGHGLVIDGSNLLAPLAGIIDALDQEAPSLGRYRRKRKVLITQREATITTGGENILAPLPPTFVFV